MSNATVAKKKHLTIRTSEQEYKRLQDFARFQGKTLSGLMLDAIYEQLEDWEDFEAVKEYEKEVAAGNVKYYTVDEVIERHNLDI